MPNFTAGTSFTDGVTNDVTAAKLNALVADAVPTSSLSLNSTTGTIATFNSTTGTITTGVIPTLTSTTLITTGTGTAAAPAIVPTGDTNTGIFFPAADTIAFSEGGAEAMRIDSSGNVGIGGTPASVLDMSKASDTSERAIKVQNSSSNLYVGIEGTSGNRFSGSSVNNAFFGTTGASGIELATNNNVRMTINSSGNVGIGMTPTAQLELSTDSAKKPSTNTWTIASDQRLKTNIINADNDRCYEIVKQVPLKRYTWKNEVYSQEQVNDRSKLGWIAQDVEAVFPKAVGTNRFAYNQVFEDVVTPELDSDGNAVLDENGVAKTKTEKRLVSEDVIEDCKDLNSDQIYAAMYGTIQKLIEKVETLEAKVAVLEAA